MTKQAGQFAQVEQKREENANQNAGAGTIDEAPQAPEQQEA